jgi:hypothetical protein
MLKESDTSQRGISSSLYSSNLSASFLYKYLNIYKSFVIQLSNFFSHISKKETPKIFFLIEGTESQRYRSYFAKMVMVRGWAYLKK